MEFNSQDIETILKLAGCNYSVRQIAVYFALDVELLFLEYKNQESVFWQTFERGRLMAAAEIDMKLLEDAKGGNLTASSQFKKASKATQLAILKDELFGIR